MRILLLLLPIAALTLIAFRARAQPANLAGFTGFSRDGKQFAWVSRSNILPDVQNLYVIGAGSTAAKSMALDLNADRAKKTLKDGGFSNQRRPLPPSVTVSTDLYANPPTVTITRNGHQQTHAIDEAPFPVSDTWEAWGVDAGGSFVAIHIFGKPVDGVLTKAQGGTLHFYRVVPLR